MFSLACTVYYQRQPSKKRCSVQKGVLNNFVNVIGTHLCWSLFLLKMQAWHLFWRKSANFRTALAPLTVAYPFYFIFSTSFLIITATSVHISVVVFLVQIHWSYFHRCYFLFPCFFCLSQFCFIFSFRWLLIKLFLPTLTSLKYTHVSNEKAIYILCKWCWNVSFGRKKVYFCKQSYRILS